MLELGKVLRGAHGRAIAPLLAAASQPWRIEDGEGRLLLGDAAATGSRHAIRVGQTELGALIGSGDMAPIAGLIAHLYDKEVEKRALATETLGRYKELTLLYAMSDKLSQHIEVDAVAESVVAETKRHLRADGVALLLHDPRRDVLAVVAAVGAEFETLRELPPDRGVEGRVFATGRAEFVEDVGATDTHVSLGDEVRSLICSPLRTGEQVLGILRVTQSAGSPWTSGDLKLVTALAANAASAIANAQRHGERVRELALKHQVERYISPRLLEAVFDGQVPPCAVPLAVAFCDLRQLSTIEPEADADRLVRRVESGVALAVDTMLAAGAAVDAPQGELVVAVFFDEAGLSAAVDRAIEAARSLVAGLERGGPGVGIASATVIDGDASALRAGINAAARLQSESAGRILLDGGVAAASSRACSPVEGLSLPGDPTDIFEVHP